MENIARNVMLRFAFVSNPNMLRSEAPKLEGHLKALVEAVQNGDALDVDPIYGHFENAVEIARDFGFFLGGYLDLGEWSKAQAHLIPHIMMVSKQRIDPNAALRDGGKDLFSKALREVEDLKKLYQEALVAYSAMRHK